MRRLRGEEGMALIMAVLILFVLLGIGTALLMSANGQERSAGNETSSESAYSLAEAALNAQIFELSLVWPTAKDAPSGGYPTRCNAASNGASYCPTPGDLSAAYPTGSTTCPPGTQGDAWSSGSSVSNGWTTYVRDAGTSASTQSLFQSSTEESMPAYDASGNNFVWVRAVGIVNCHTAVVVAKVSAQVASLQFPNLVLDANSFTISNSGNKDVLNLADVSGQDSQPSAISLRCTGSAYGNGAQPPDSACAGINKSSQVVPSSPTYVEPPDPSPTLNATQLAAVQAMAEADGTYYPPGDCNFTNPSATGAANGGLSGLPVYIAGPCTVSLSSNATINSLSSPGFLVLANGTFSMTGGATYYGVIYAANQGGLTGNVVTLSGNSTVVGGINADGNALLTLGDSGNGATSCTDTGNSHKCGDLEYDAAAFDALNGFFGADATPNSFRQLPINQ